MPKELTKLQYKLQKLEKKAKRLDNVEDFVTGFMCGVPCFIVDIPVALFVGTPLITSILINSKRIENYKKHIIANIEYQLSNKIVSEERIKSLSNLREELILQLQEEKIEINPKDIEKIKQKIR